MTEINKVTKPRKSKTETDLIDELAAAERKAASIKQRLHANKLDSVIINSKIVEAFQSIQNAYTDLSDVFILEVVAKAFGIPRLTITQAPKATRKPKAPK